MRLRSLLLLIVVILSLPWAAVGVTSAAQSIYLSDVSYFRESLKTPLSMLQAYERFEHQKNVNTTQHRLLTFGINDDAIWVRLKINNLNPHPEMRRLIAAQTWTDYLDVYLISPQQPIEHWYVGDRQEAGPHLLPEVGYVFNFHVPPGQTELLIRAQSKDPLVLPLELESVQHARQSDAIDHVMSGLLFGVLMTLVGYNIILYLTLKQLDSLFYSLYISCFVILNFAYSGYAFAWVYPHLPLVQNYSILLFMVLHGVFGLIFVSQFLQLPSRRPLLASIIRVYNSVGVIAIAGFIMARMQLYSALLAFCFLSLTSILMIVVGIWNLGKVRDSQYFLLAVLCSMIGVLITAMSVWGVIPFTYYSYHAATYGVVCEAAILAVVLANRLKRIERERIATKYLSSYDPLTKLLNRRGFVEKSNKILEHKVFATQPLSLAIIDVDYFKVINDTHGHQIGDLALSHLSQLLKRHTEAQDVVARWGGEEFVVLFPNTDFAQTYTDAEHLRAVIETSPLILDDRSVSMTASFGLATRDPHESIESLLARADQHLYAAKSQGRNCVQPQPSMHTAPLID
ncbi:sensor domain-containing diguanylate cyclase [Vibrio sp. AK197]